MQIWSFFYNLSYLSTKIMPIMKLHPVILSAAIMVLCSCSERETYYTLSGITQGGEYHITFCDVNEAGKRIPHEIITSVTDSALLSVDRTFSGYNRHSLLSKVNNAPSSIPLGDMFSDLYSTCFNLWQETDGLFDIAAAPLFDFWGFGFTDPEKMAKLRSSADTPAIIDSLLQFSGMQHLMLIRSTSHSHVLKKDDARVRLNFNAVAQGYTCDLIARRFEQMGIRNYLIDVGMEIRCSGVNASGSKWRIGIDAPIDGNMTAGENIQDVVEVTDCGIVTSGNYRKFFIGEDGEKYAHSINPKTGYPVRDSLLSATVITKNATLADAYATYCMVLGYEKAVKFLESRDDLHGYLITPHGVYKKL